MLGWRRRHLKSAAIPSRTANDALWPMPRPYLRERFVCQAANLFNVAHEEALSRIKGHFKNPSDRAYDRGIGFPYPSSKLFVLDIVRWRKHVSAKNLGKIVEKLYDDHKLKGFRKEARQRYLEGGKEVEDPAEAQSDSSDEDGIEQMAVTVRMEED